MKTLIDLKQFRGIHESVGWVFPFNLITKEKKVNTFPSTPACTPPKTSKESKGEVKIVCLRGNQKAFIKIKIVLKNMFVDKVIY